MKTCDVCQKKTDGLTELRDIYKSDYAKEVCEDCRHVLDKQLNKIQSATVQIQIGWFKNFIKNLKVTK